MQLHAIPLALLLTVTAVAGCLSNESPTSDTGTYLPDQDHNLFRVAVGDDGGRVVFTHAPGAIGTLTNQDDGAVVVQFPFGTLQIVEADSGKMQLQSIPAAGLNVTGGATVTFLSPPREGPFAMTFDGERRTFDPESAPGYEEPTNELLSGENVWDLSAYQEEHFPDRRPNAPDGNYWTAIEYFVEYFEALGMDVEVDPYNTQAATGNGANCLPDGPTRGICPGSLANVVATLPGTDPDAPTIFVAGGHFDVVTETTHAAFDDTSGTVSTMELARAMSQFEWRHTLKFGLWGGEEDGILGSQFWVKTNPDAVATITSYWNLDVVGMSWPAPTVEPDPIVIAAGPDIPSDQYGGAAGPIATELLRFAEHLQADWFGFPTAVGGDRMFYYEGVVSGQATGYAAVNAQSDHTPFMAAGIPAYFIFNGDALRNPIGIHNERDTLTNMTLYSIWGPDKLGVALALQDDTGEAPEYTTAEWQEGKAALAESWETVMWFPFYSTVLQDLEMWHTPSVADLQDYLQSQSPVSTPA